MVGCIFDIKRFAIHDGPGIRTTIFMMGCPMKCRWCHNPECLAGKEKIFEKKVMLDDQSFIIKQSVAKKVTATCVIAEVLKDLVFFKESGGGVTFSGGEPFHQPGFLMSMLNISKREGLHTCIDTSGYADVTYLRKVLPLTDLFLYDLKLIDNNDHLKYTGVSNKLILDNLEMLAGKPNKVILRLPVIPGITDTMKNLSSVAELMNKLQLDRIVLLPYHKTGKHKYSLLDRDYEMKNVPEPSARDMEKAGAFFENRGISILRDDVPEKMGHRP